MQSEVLLAALKRKRDQTKVPKTRAAMDGMIKAQEVIVKARRKALRPRLFVASKSANVKFL